MFSIFNNKEINAEKLESEKNLDWRINLLEYYCGLTINFQDNWNRIRENYALKNNQLNKEDYRILCDNSPLASTDKIDHFINAFNHTHNIIETLKGEELGRPFSFDIVNTSPDVSNRLERDKRRQIEIITAKIFENESNKDKEIRELYNSNRTKGLNPQKIESMKQEIEDKYDKLFKKIPDISSIIDRYKNISTLEEVALSKIMRMLITKQHIKYTKNQGFEDVLLAAEEYVVVESFDDKLPTIKLLNPLNVVYHKSSDTQFIQDGDFAAYIEYPTLQEVLHKYNNKLTKEEKETIFFTHNLRGIAGLDYTYGSEPQANWVNEERYLNGIGTARRNSSWVHMGNQFGGENQAWARLPNYMHTIGSYSNTVTTKQNDFVEVYNVYWKTQRKIGKLQHINEYGEEDITYVDELFYIPEYAEEYITKFENSNEDIIEYKWKFKELDYKLQWIWIPEVWKGIRLAYNVYVDIGPIKHAYQSLLDPYEVKLPIHGLVFNNRNAQSLSIMDRMKDWQKLYYATMTKLLKIMSQDKGVWTFINAAFVDGTELDLQQFMTVLEDTGVAYYNPFGKDSIASLNSFKIAESIDMTSTRYISQYIEWLKVIEFNIQKSAGMSDQRIAQTNPRMTATDNYRNTSSSINMSEPTFALHDLLWEKILQTYMECLISVVKNNPLVIRGLLNDEERVVFDSNQLDLDDNFVLMVGDNTKAYRTLEQFKQLSQALIQNDKADLSTLIDLVRTDNLSEFQVKLREVDENNRKRQEQMQQMQQQHEKEMTQMQIKAKEDIQIQELHNTYLRGVMDYNRSEMQSMYSNTAFDTEKDYNKDGIADYRQMEQLQQKINNETRKIDLDEKELILKESKIRNDTEKTNVNESKKIELTKQELEMKERIEKAKIKAMKSKMKK